MKRVILIIALCLLSTVAFASMDMAIGGAFNIGFIGGVYPGGALTVKLPQLPLVIGAGATVGSRVVNIGITLDWWLYRAPLFGIVSIYVGPGLYLKIATPLDIGARVPVGLQIFVIDPLELFVEIAPQMGVGLGDPVKFPTFGLMGAVGFRFWF